MSPYCLVFRLNTDFKPMEYVCYFDSHLDPLLFIIYALDLFVEITQSVPVTGKMTSTGQELVQSATG